MKILMKIGKNLLLIDKSFDKIRQRIGKFQKSLKMVMFLIAKYEKNNV